MTPGPDWAELERLGLYDPGAPEAAQRRELLEHYLAKGLDAETMVAAAREGRLVMLGGDLGMRPGRDRYTAVDLAERVGLDVELVEAALRAAGLPRVDRDVPYYSDDDVTLLEGFKGAAELFGVDDLLSFVRVMGMAVARVATGAVHLANATLHGPLHQAGASELERSQANELATVALASIPPAMAAILRHHAETELRRSFLSDQEPGSRTATLAVAFLDLVGFTTVSAELGADELADAVADFEAMAVDVVAAHGGRVVKVIGDEVMYVNHDAASACATAGELRAAVNRHPALTSLRGGLTHGTVVTLDGDYYGAEVNLAARLVAAAEPDQVLVTPAVVSSVPDGRFLAAGTRDLKGFSEPVEVFSLAG